MTSVRENERIVVGKTQEKAQEKSFDPVPPYSRFPGHQFSFEITKRRKKGASKIEEK
jgi:hypothetical protein